MANFVGWLHRQKYAVRALLQQKRCLVCHEAFTLPDSRDLPSQNYQDLAQDFLCKKCLPLFSQRQYGFCPCCGEPSEAENLSIVRCPSCLASPPPWRTYFFHNLYAGPMQDLLSKAKFGEGLAECKLCGVLLAGHADLYAHKNQYDAIIPLPLHKRRLQERGYNQTLEIARPLAKIMEVPIQASWLIRTVHGPRQSSLGRKERHNNIKGVFDAKNAVNDKRVLLLDDIMTTGATLREAVKILLKSGAIFVDVAVVARTPFK